MSLHPEDVPSLVVRARRGDASARGELIERCRPRLLERIRFMMGDDARRVAESGDFVQSVLIEALGRADESMLADDRRLLRWMTAAARNNIRDAVRRRREAALESFAGSGTWSLDDPAQPPSPATHADQFERLAVLAETIEELTQEQRRVIELREFEHKSFPDIARELGGTDDRVRLLHGKAMLRLGELIARRGL
jgi:RNA polymerase sigma factor (sigma-70 family)